jgi:hypothetical protein
VNEHTPGPWIVGAHFAERLGGRTYIPILRPGNDPVPIAVVHRDVDGYGQGEGEANASLIAAAPDMRKVLQDITRWAEKNNRWDKTEWADAYAAIAKAAASQQPGPK